MAQKTTYEHPKIKLCPVCNGSEIEYNFHPYDLLHADPIQSTCSSCLGTGRVVESKEIITRVESFDPIKHKHLC